jgi:predicted TIM-barrel fold metal-dependent hydrolase
VRKIFDSGSRSAEEFRRLVNDRQLALFAEVSPQYEGKRLDDPIWEPYFALAGVLDIPVGVHLGEGPLVLPTGRRRAIARSLAPRCNWKRC